jgi:hypothetical protein
MSMEHRWNDTDREKPKDLEKKKYHCKFFHKKNPTKKVWYLSWASAVRCKELTVSTTVHAT